MEPKAHPPSERPARVRLLAPDHDAEWRLQRARRLATAARWAMGFLLACNLGLHGSAGYAQAWLPGLHHLAAADSGWMAAWAQMWAQGMQAVGAARVAAAQFGVDTLLAFALLTGWWLPALAWLGLIDALLQWSVIAGFAPTAPQLTLALGFAMLWLLRGWEGASWAAATDSPWLGDAARTHRARRVYWALWLLAVFWGVQSLALWLQVVRPMQAAVPFAVVTSGRPDWVVEAQSLFNGLQLAIDHPAWFWWLAVMATATLLGLLIAVWRPGSRYRFLPWAGVAVALGCWLSAGPLGSLLGAPLPGAGGDALGAGLWAAVCFVWAAVALLHASRPGSAQSAGPGTDDWVTTQPG